MKDVFITRISNFFPNDPISNDEMESYLGMVGGVPSNSKSLVLRNNGIKRRFYSFDKNGNIRLAASHDTPKDTRPIASSQKM